MGFLDWLLGKPEKSKESMPVCPGCKKVASKTRRSSIYISKNVPQSIEYYCDCGYPGPVVWISAKDAKDGKGPEILKKAREEYENSIKRDNLRKDKRA